jgi:hypothetical protein
MTVAIFSTLSKLNQHGLGRGLPERGVGSGEVVVYCLPEISRQNRLNPKTLCYSETFFSFKKQEHVSEFVKTIQSECAFVNG